MECRLLYSKTSYSEYAYNKLTLTEELFSFPVTLLHILSLMDITNCAYNELKLPVPGTSL